MIYLCMSSSFTFFICCSSRDLIWMPRLYKCITLVHFVCLIEYVSRMNSTREVLIHTPRLDGGCSIHLDATSLPFSFLWPSSTSRLPYLDEGLLDYECCKALFFGCMLSFILSVCNNFGPPHCLAVSLKLCLFYYHNSKIYG